MEIVRAAQAEIGFEDVAVERGGGQGLGDRGRHAQPRRRRQDHVQALAEKGVNIQVISTSEIKISVLIDAAYTELAVRALHAAYGLDQL